MAMPQNIQYGNQTGDTSRNSIRRLVAQEGNDAAAEERVVMALCIATPPRHDVGWINTDFMRSRIRKAQGRKKRESYYGIL